MNSAEPNYIPQILAYFGDASSQVRLSVVFALLLFGSVTIFLRNNKLHSEIIGLFRDKLRANHIYNLFKRIIAGSFILLALLALFIFGSPILSQYIMGMQISDIGNSLSGDGEEEKDPALRALHDGLYKQSRQLFIRRLSLTRDTKAIDEIRGYITATFYGQGLHREGLQFICDSYKDHAKGDYRYLFNIHAHIRKIALNEGYDVAENIAKTFFNRCNRADFSAIWAGIPLGFMESLHEGSSLFSSNNYGYSDFADFGLANIVSEADSRYLMPLIDSGQWKEKPDERDYPMYPFALYVLGRFDDVLATYPSHYAQLRELTLFDAGEYTTNVSEKIARWERLLKEFPDGQWRSSAITQLMKVYHDKHDSANAERCLRLLDKDLREYQVGKLVQSQVDAGDTLLSLGDFDGAVSHISAANAAYNRYGVPNIEISQKERNAIVAARWSREVKPSRQLVVALRMRYEFEWVHPSTSFLLKKVDAMSADIETYAKTLYIIASGYRRMGEYGQSAKILQRFLATVPSSNPLTDDVIAELGYYQFVLLGNPAAARRHFLKIVKIYPDRNAYDDALWWLGQIAQSQKNYPLAIKYYSEILKIQGTNFYHRASKKMRESMYPSEVSTM